MADGRYFKLLIALTALATLGLASGCGGSSQGAESAPPPPAEAEPVPESPPESAEAKEEPETPVPAQPAEPEFKPGGSVLDAVNAIPQGAERVEIEHEVLVAPLLQAELYAPCKLRPNQHFSVKVAVWDGRVVGLDLDAKPKGQAVEECLRQQIQALTWKKKAKSLSTVEFNY